MKRPSHPFVRPNHIGWRVYNLNLLILQLSPFSCYSLPPSLFPRRNILFRTMNLYFAFNMKGRVSHSHRLSVSLRVFWFHLQKKSSNVWHIVELLCKFQYMSAYVSSICYLRRVIQDTLFKLQAKKNHLPLHSNEIRCCPSRVLRQRIFSRDTRVSVILIGRLPLTPVLQKRSICEDGVLRSRTCVHSPILFPTESLAALRESFSSVYPDKEVPNKTTVRPLVKKFWDTEMFKRANTPGVEQL
jgi:hypothetical protein